MLNTQSQFIPDQGFETLLTTRPTNLKKLSAELTKNGEYDIARMDQVHGSNIGIVTKKGNQTHTDTDALITTNTNMWLSVKTADCLPLIITHPYPLISVIHAGRRGSEDGITEKTLALIKRDYGLSSRFTMWFGPAICKSCYEIDKANKIHYDLIETNLAQIEKNVSDSCFYFSEICTFCQSDKFFSYRKGDRNERILSLVRINSFKPSQFIGTLHLDHAEKDIADIRDEWAH